jgi:hypothetical protein
MLDLIASHARFVKSFRIFLYEYEGDLFRFKAEITFTNESKLFIKEYVFGNKESSVTKFYFLFHSFPFTCEFF